MKRRRASLGKTTRPSPAGVLPRERLFALLDEAEAPAIWVSGPPGSGKTTLAASWLEHAGIPYVWYQLDEGDADVATFFYYLSLAADEHAEAGAEPLPLLAPEYQAGLALFTRRYFQQLFSRLKAPFALVFDNCQEVPTSSPLVEVMRLGLQELPPGARGVFLSRTDPPPALARQRANRTLASLGWEDLRLRREESAAIVAQRRPGLSPEAVETLYARTQGWAAGLMLMLEQSNPPASLAQPVDLSTRRLVFDYLAGEIFQKLNERMQRFLLQTAYVPQMTPAIAAELTGDEDAGQIVAQLHRFNYFVSLRETQPEPHYQYHPMLRDFLQARAEETLPKERRRALQKISAVQMERAGAIEDAIALYRESHEWEEMARVAEGHAQALLAQGRGETLARWVEELPAETQAKHPWAVYWAAGSQAQLAPREGRIQYGRAFDLFRAQGDAAGMALAASGAMFAILYELDDFSLLDRWIAVLDEAEKTGARPPSPEMEAGLACGMFIALTLRQPHRRDIKQWIERALASSAATPDVNLRMFVGLLAALTLGWTGLFARAGQLIESMRQLSPAPGVTPFSLITLKNLEAMHAMLTADEPASQRAMREGLDIAQATGVQTWNFQLLLYGYGGALGAGDLAAAATLARRLHAQPGGGRFNLCMFQFFQGWEALLRRDRMDALQKCKSALRTAIEVGCPLFEVLCRLQLAEVLVDCGDERKCIAHLQALRDIARRIDNAHLEFTCLLWFAHIALAHGRQRPGLNALRRALALGREYGYAHFLGWRPAPMARVLAAALEAGLEPDYARSVIRRRRLVPEEVRPSGNEWPWTFRVQTFGGFRLLRDDEPLATAGKAQRRPLELLKVAIAYGGAQVSEGRVIDALWPRVDGDSAHRSFTSALHRLRKLLGEDRAVLLHEGKVSLDRRYFWVDAWEFEDLAAREEASGDAGQREKLIERMLSLYRGPFMADDVDDAWMLQTRERLRARLARAMGRMLRHWQECGQRERAREYEERIKQSVSDR
ncbi:MAG TPA: BTAD domain-containing putative transcriptional regulator [Burkholderiales bacterium]|nr:BTAD domain-containing putative transcriptional regulator [Burkholderiales bacterium]